MINPVYHSQIHSNLKSTNFGSNIKTIKVDTEADFIEEIRKGKEELITTGHMMYDKGLTAGTGGNISCKCGDFILITAARTCLGRLNPEDITVVSKKGEVISGRKPSSELPVHLEAYKQRDDIKAVIHSHSPYIQTFAIANKSIDENILPDVVKNFGEIKCDVYHPPGSKELAEKTAKFLKEDKLIMMGNHGLLSTGPDLKGALKVADTAEHYAKVCYLVNNANIGKENIPTKEVERLRNL